MATPAQKKLAQQRLADMREAKQVRFTWPKWTGFSGKTLWDCLNLIAALAIPLVVVLATIGFGFWQTQLADMQHQNDLKIAQDNRQNDLKIADDQQQEATLKAYLDDMTTLLLDKKLGSQSPADKAASAEAALVGQAKTLTTLRRLTNPQRKATVLQFLYQARLIGYLPCDTCPIIAPVIYLGGADLSNVALHGTIRFDAAEHSFSVFHLYLGGADLSGADLSGADLVYTTLSHVELFNADLVNADLLGADLRDADLRVARLNGADLSGADLSSANLGGANLHGARYNTIGLKGGDAQWTPSQALVPTQWPQEFDPKGAGAICVDC